MDWLRCRLISRLGWVICGRQIPNQVFERLRKKRLAANRSEPLFTAAGQLVTTRLPLTFH